MISRLHIGSYWRWTVLKRFLQLGPGLRVLDAGCSDGYVSQELAKVGCNVLGVDVATEVIERNIRRCMGDPHQRFLAVPIERLTPGQVGTFDIIVSIDVLMHLKDPEAALMAMRRLIRSGGLLYITIVLGGYTDCRWTTEAEVREACQRSGWGIDVIQKIYYSPSFDLANRIQRAIFSIGFNRKRSGPVVNNFSQTRAFAIGSKHRMLLRAYWIPAIMLRLLAMADSIPFITRKGDTIALRAYPR